MGRMRRSAPISIPVRLVLMLGSVVLSTSSLVGCQSMWERVRENERSLSIDAARTNAKRGNCAPALQDLDRAEAIMAIDQFALEAIQMRIRCYEKLGANELRAAHRRLLDDFYTEHPMAFPASDGSSSFRAQGALPQRIERAPSWFTIARPRYTPYAQRSKIVGRVVVTFGLAANGKTTDIRILEMPHPLLASWAIDAVAAAKPARGMKNKIPVIESDRAYLSTFNFEWRWADEPEETSSSSAPLPR